MLDKPMILKDRMARKARFEQLNCVHIATLTAFVDDVRDKQPLADRNIPYFDPWDGGINAEILFLLEAPGDKAVLSGFISRNNPDGSAKNFFVLNAEANIPRNRTLSWNIVPWYVGKNNVTQEDVDKGMSILTELICRLKGLKIIIFVGKWAARAEEEIRRRYPMFKLYKMPHPSPSNINTNPIRRKEILQVLLRVRNDMLVGQ